QDAVAGDVAQKVDASELPVEGGEQGADLLGPRHVALGGDGPAAERSDGLGGGAGAGDVAIDQQQIGAVLGQGDRHRPAEALGGAADNSDSSRQVEQVHAAGPLPANWSRSYRPCHLGGAKDHFTNHRVTEDTEEQELSCAFSVSSVTL